MALLFERSLPGVPVPACAGIDVHGVTCDSRAVRPGWCFVAVRGSRCDGHDYVGEAAARGAAVLVVQRGRPAGQVAGTAVVQVADTLEALARLAAEHTGLAVRQRQGLLRVVGVTGTNGKSTFCYLVRSILRQAGRRAALLGTIEYDLVCRQVPAPLTTPGATELASLLVEAADAGAGFAVIEVSSHALSQRRTDGVAFEVAAFTNLTRDHLDYHGDLAAYLAAKKRLFDGLSPEATAVVNADDGSAEAIIRDCRARLLRYGFGECEVAAAIRSSGADGSVFELALPAGRVTVRSPLLGRHNVANAMAAAAATTAIGVDVEDVRRGIEAVASVPGRLQRVEFPGSPVSVLVDYAHTDDALRNVLQAVRSFAENRPLTVVFGCGGDRDRTKRPLMARAVQALADKIIVTSDNPRTEDPRAIVAEVVAGFDAAHRKRVAVLVDRREAIERAIAEAQAGEVVLVAGKGHEPYQEIRGRRFAFDDRQVAGDALRKRFGGGR